MSQEQPSTERILDDAKRVAESGDLSAAATALRQAIGIDMLDPRLRAGLAVVLRAQGKVQEAIDAWLSAIALDPNAAEPHYDLALTLEAAGRNAEAIPHLRTTIELEPEFPDAYLQLADAVRRQGNVEEAVELCRRALQLDPEDCDGHQLLGAMLVARRSLDEAERHLLEAMRLADSSDDPNQMRMIVLANLGVAYACRNRATEALAAFEQALKISPDDPDAHWNRAQTLLCLGNFANGWAEYEWRWKVEPLKSAPRAYDTPQWDGTPLAGRTILIHSEQGLGDTIQFCRYAPILAASGARVLLKCPAALRSLLETLSGVSEWFTDGETPSQFDAHAPLLSLPRLCGTMSNDQIPADVPYLRATEERAQYWQSKLPPKRGKLRVGLVWAGNAGHPNDLARSIPFSAFEPLRQLSGDIDFYSLQKGVAATQLVAATFAPVEMGSELNDFADTAALLANLDLLISADTAAAHLAGAMARPVWTLLPFRPDWRWQFEREDSPWYPAMRLFRQPRLDDWAAVMRRVADELMKMIQSR